MTGRHLWGGEGDSGTLCPQACPPCPVTSWEVKRTRRGSARPPCRRLSGKRQKRATFRAYMLAMEPPARGQ